jgi:DNA ligase-1
MSKNILESIKYCIDRLNSSNSSKDKSRVFKELYDSGYINVDLWKLIHNFDVLFHITSSRIKKDFINSKEPTKYSSIIDLLNDLNNGLTGNNALKEVCKFISANKEYESLICDIIDKDLHIGISASTMNEIVPGLFKEFKVSLAKSLNKEKLDSSWIIEHKLDGVRCCCLIKSSDDIKFYSRKGKEFTTLGVLRDEIKYLVDTGKLPTNIALDGEICVVDENGNEDFKSVMKEIKRKDYTMQTPMYIVFDILPLEDFNVGYSETTYKLRFNRLKCLISSLNTQCMRLVEAEEYSDESIKIWKRKVFENNWEGLIVRKDEPYRAERNSTMLKIKEFIDAEYIVKDVEMDGDATILVDGKTERIKCVKRLVIEHKGNKVGVGSGLSQEQRIDFYINPEHIIGKTVCIRYFEETVDDNGLPSLRFPTLKYVYENERDV